HAVHSATGEQVEHPGDALLGLVEGRGIGVGIDTRDRNVGAKTINKQRAQREQDALLEDLRLGEGREVQISGKLLGCGRHSRLSLLCVGERKNDNQSSARRSTARRDQASALVSSTLGISILPPSASMA